MIDVQIIPILKDNYAYLLIGERGKTAIIDPGEAAPIIAELERQNLSLDYILNTHHHGDHIAGNGALIEKFDAKLVGPSKESIRISGMDITLSEGDHFSFDGEDVQILETPGHTSGHICFYFPASEMVFTGDALFLMSVGRLFEGTPEELWTTLRKLTALPDATKVYCGHEYTLSNAEFCLSVEPNNQALQARMDEVQTIRDEGRTTMPGTIAQEKQTNVFIRAESVERLAEIRKLKDEF